MDIRQLRYFIAIAEAGSLSRAAERLHVAQPALSQHVLLMEASLGVRILQRNPRGIALTEAGLRLLQQARDITGQFAALSDHVRGSAVPSGTVRFGMPGTINEQLGATLIEQGLQNYPAVRLRISEAMSGFVLGWLREGTVDLAMLYNVTDEKGLKLHHALTEEICLFAGLQTKFPPSGLRCSLATALRLPLVLPGPGHGLRDLIETAAKSVRKQVNPAIEIDSYRQIKQLAQRGLAFGILPRTAIKQELAEGVFRAWTLEKPALMRRIYLGYRSGSPLSAASRAIGQLSWTILETLVRNGNWAATWNSDKHENATPF